MIINTNVSSITAQEAATNTGKSIKSSLEKLSTGLKINKASDDASGLAIADKLRTQASSIDQGIANGNSAVTLLQIADKSMAEQSNILDTIKSKLIQANTDTTSTDGRESIRKDISKLLEQLDNIAEQTNYNGNVLLQSAAGDTDADKAASNSLSFQIGESKNDIISNTSVQSNTFGLGSQETYASGTTIAQDSSVTLAAAGTITLKGTDSTDTAAIENVTLTGDVDTIALTAGMTFSNVNDETKAVLDAQVTAGNLSESGGTYSVTTAGAGNSLSLTAVSDVQMDVQNTGSTVSIAAGDIIENITNATGSALTTALADTSKFTEIATGIYLSNASQDIGLTTAEQLDQTTPTELVSGTGSSTFNAGDKITVESVTTGSMLDNALKTTGLFSGGTGGVYTVNDDYTAGSLFIGSSESITITQGSAVSVAAPAAGLAESVLTFNGATAYRDSATGGTAINSDQATAGTQINASGDDTVKFTLTASGTGSTAGASFSIQAGDIITFTDVTTTAGGGDAFSESILESENFFHLGGNEYQAQTTTAVTLTTGDAITVERHVGGSGAEETIAGPSAETIKGSESAAKIAVTTDTTFNVTNTETTTGNVLTIEGTDITNGEDQLSSLAALNSGELTTDLADSFQAVVDDAITKLNGYRGDIGSTQNQVESAVRNLMTQSTNVQAAESIIRDVDYASESANFNKQNIISQAGSYAISQANSVQQNVLKLLQ